METIQEQKSTEALLRYQRIAPLLEEGLTPAERGELRRKIAEKENISERSLFRYEKNYRDGGFQALFPDYGKKQKLAGHSPDPDDYDRLILKIAVLRKENPSRSIDRCIFILEQEGEAPEGLLKRSTVQRRLQKLGLGYRQIRKQAENKKNSSARHQQPHRMMMVQADYKDGPKLPTGKNGKREETHLLVLIDDCTRYVIHSAFYPNEKEENIETGLRDAITRFGIFDRYYTDNGSCFISSDLKKPWDVSEYRTRVAVRAGRREREKWKSSIRWRTCSSVK